MSKRTRKRQTRNISQTIFWIMSGLLAVSMVISLIIVALPGPPAATPTPLPTWTPAPPPTITPSSLPPEPSPTSPLLPSPTAEPTEPAIGPLPATDTPAATPTPTFTSPPAFTVTPTPTLTVTPTLTATPSSAGLAFAFAAAGDSRSGPAIYGRVLESVMADGSRFLVHTGDLVNKGTEDQWQAFQQTMAGFALPFYPVPGNHDSLSGALDGFLTYSGAPAAHYSFDRPPVHFTLADSHHGGIGAAELAWLREDLGATAQPVKIVVLHHPPFDPDGTDHIMAYGNKEFMALMVEQAVDYVLAGHIHAYARAERDGVVYIVTGGAGAPLYAAGHPQAFHHYVRFTVWEDETITVEVIRV